jgi:membrane protein DedA with SNARE-associated domain
VSLLLALASGRALEYLLGWFGRFHYMAPFCVLMLCGLGAPLPEEVTLIGCGFLLSQGEVEFWKITLVCTVAILLGDSIPYWLGRHYGLSALKTRWVAKILHPERFAKLERRFADNGNWAIFTCRFLPGLRIPGYFVAGTLRMSYTRFLTIDTLGVAVSVPTSIWLSLLVFRKIGFDEEAVQAASKKLSEYNHYIWIGLALLIVGVFLWRKFKKRTKGPRSPTGPAAPVSGPAIEDLPTTMPIPEPTSGPSSGPNSGPPPASVPTTASPPAKTPRSAALPPRDDVG